jgi:L-ascorbate metabolism protein UlaG (beta-lactamase superfamily)
VRLTKYTHSCVRISDDGDRRLVIDPGEFSETAEALAGIDHVLITHGHPDHLDIPALVAAAALNPSLALWGPRDVADQLASVPELAGRITVVGPGQSFVAGGLQVRTYGGQHALIHSSVPVVSNIAFLVGDAVYHPGDSFTVPPARVEVLLAPLQAPWARIADTLDFLIAMRAPLAWPIHDGLVAERGRAIYDGHLTRIAELYGETTYHAPRPGEVIDL